MHNVYIGIGTNIEPRSERMEKAIDTLRSLGSIAKESAIYETAPFGYTDQPNFLNKVILLQTEMELVELHQTLKNSEIDLGRKERQRWHEREIDFDILFFDDIVFNSETLTVPHPEIQHRSFVLQPMDEIAPEFIHPLVQKTIRSLLNELQS